jgi:hypothetical protein
MSQLEPETQDVLSGRSSGQPVVSPTGRRPATAVLCRCEGGISTAADLEGGEQDQHYRSHGEDAVRDHDGVRDALLGQH